MYMNNIISGMYEISQAEPFQMAYYTSLVLVLRHIFNILQRLRLRGRKMIGFEHVTLFDRWILQGCRLHAKHHLQKRKEESNLQLKGVQRLTGYTCTSVLF